MIWAGHLTGIKFRRLLISKSRGSNLCVDSTSGGTSKRKSKAQNDFPLIWLNTQIQYEPQKLIPACGWPEIMMHRRFPLISVILHQRQGPRTVSKTAYTSINRSASQMIAPIEMQELSFRRSCAKRGTRQHTVQHPLEANTSLSLVSLLCWLCVHGGIQEKSLSHLIMSELNLYLVSGDRNAWNLGLFHHVLYPKLTLNRNTETCRISVFAINVFVNWIRQLYRWKQPQTAFYRCWRKMFPEGLIHIYSSNHLFL